MRLHETHQEPGVYDGAFIFAAAGLGLLIAVWYVAVHRFHFSDRQFIEALGYVVIPATGVGCWIWLLATGRSRRENCWPHPYQVISPKKMSGSRVMRG